MIRIICLWNILLLISSLAFSQVSQKMGPEWEDIRIEVRDPYAKLLNEAQMTLVEIAPNFVNKEVLNKEFFLTNELDTDLVEMIGEEVIQRSADADYFSYQINTAKDYFLVCAHEGFRTFQTTINGACLSEKTYYVVHLQAQSLDYYLPKVEEKLIASSDDLEAPHYNIPSSFISQNSIDFPIASEQAQAQVEVFVAASNNEETDEIFTEKGGIILEKDKAEPLVFTNKGLSEKWTFSNLLYDFNKSDLNEVSTQELDKVITYLQENPNISLRIESHTDQIGSESYNQVLSLERSLSTKDYLVAQGIDATRIKALGYGECRPIASCPEGIPCLPSIHEKNRRTELVFY